MKLLILLLGILFFNQIYPKQKFYKWTDSEGNIHYSQDKPHDKTTSEIKVDNFQPKIVEDIVNEDIANTVEENSLSNEKEKSYSEKLKERREKNKIKNKKTIQTKKDCKAAKKTFEKFSRKERFRHKDKKTGEYVYLEDGDRTLLLKEAKTAIKKNCR